MDRIINELSFYTGLSNSMISSFVYENDHYTNYYKKAYIRKKNGGLRVVYMPSPEVKLLQHFIKEKYLSNYPISEFATAYRKNKNVVDNAKAHCKNKSFLFIDVHDFFNSIKYDILFSKMKKINSNCLSDAELKLLLHICSYKKEFVQGCVTSPDLSNIYMYDFDLFANSLARNLPNGVYTRYSDDITISSSEKIPQEVLDNIERELSLIGLSINKQKTHYCSNLQNVEITGIRIKENCTVSLDTSFKKELKTRIFNKLKYGDQSSENASELIGLLNYLKMVDIRYYNNINFKYSLAGAGLCIDRLKKLAK